MVVDPLALVAAAVALLAGLAGCTTTPRAAGGLTPVTAAAAASGQPNPTPTNPTPTPTAPSPSLSATTGSPDPGLSAGQITRTFLLLNDYWVVQLNDCYWTENGDTTLYLGAHFEIEYAGLLGGKKTSYALTDSADTYTVSGSVAPGTPFVQQIGGQKFAVSHYPGTTVVLTMKITPPGLDTNGADNTVKVSITVPSSPPLPDLAEPLTC